MQLIRSGMDWSGGLVPPLGGPEPYKQVNLCQTWGVDNGGERLTGQVARELGECRIRGIDRIDVKNRNQDPLAVHELRRLAAQYAAAQAGSRGTQTQIRSLLRAAIEELRRSNPANADLIQALFFGEGDSSGRRYPRDMLRQAQKRYGEPSEDRFREIRNIAFREFADFLINFVSEPARPAAPVISLPSPAHSPLAHPAEAAEATADRRVVLAPLVAVLRFSLVDPGITDNLTIDEHQAIIAKRGSCWWGWFKSAEDDDHSAEIERRIENCEIGLWERSEGVFYIARCDDARTADGSLVESPDKELTPAYYRTQPYPAWFKFRSISRSSKREFEERFGYLPNTPPTILWSSGVQPQPVNIRAYGNTILHLSDLRFGQHHRWNTLRAPHRTHMTAEQAIVQTLLVHDIDLAEVALVVICGNFVSGVPSPEAYGEALAFIDNLCERLHGLSREHIVVVPGAEDFSRPGDRERSVQILYREFHQSLYSNDDQDISRIRRYESDTFRLNILPVNSVKMLGENEEDDGMFGYGYDGQLYVMREDYLHNHQSTRVINAVAAHHHIMPTTVKLPVTVRQEPPRARVMLGMYDSLDLRSKLSASRVALYLHGHLHDPDCYAIVSDDGWQTGIIGAGTAGASDPWLRERFRDNRGNSLAVIKIESNAIIGSIFLYNEDFRDQARPFKQLHIKDQ